MCPFRLSYNVEYLKFHDFITYIQHLLETSQNKIDLWLDIDGVLLTTLPPVQYSKFFYTLVECIAKNKDKIRARIITGRKPNTLPIEYKNTLISKLNIQEGDFYDNMMPSIPNLRQMIANKVNKIVSVYANYPDGKPSDDTTVIFCDDVIDVYADCDVLDFIPGVDAMGISLALYGETKIYRPSNRKLEDISQGKTFEEWLNGLYDMDTKLVYGQDYSLIQAREKKSYRFSLKPSGLKLITNNINYSWFYDIMNLWPTQLLDPLHTDFSIYSSLCYLIDRIDQHPMFKYTLEFLQSINFVADSNSLKIRLKRLYMDDKIATQGFPASKYNIFNHIFIGELNNNVTGGLHCFYRMLMLSETYWLVLKDVYLYENNFFAAFSQSGPSVNSKMNGCILGVSPMFDFFYNAVMLFLNTSAVEVRPSKVIDFKLKGVDLVYVLYRGLDGCNASGFTSIKFCSSIYADKLS